MKLRVGRWLLLVVSTVAVYSACAGESNMDKVRPAACAGSWYPADAAELSQMVDKWLDDAEGGGKRKPLALIVPHAGYRFSGPTAAAAFAKLRGHSYERVIVLAFSHRHAGRYHGVDVPKDISAYDTPLGKIEIDKKACAKLLEKSPFVSTPGIGDDEHSLELQLPFLQRVLKEKFELVPLYLGVMDDRDIVAAAQLLAPLIDDKTLLVASTDFTHYGPNFGYTPFADNIPDGVKKLADGASGPICCCDYDGFVDHIVKTKDTICGRGPVKLLLRILSMRGGARGERIVYETSGKILNDWSNTVTYQSFEFTDRPGTLSEEERAELLRIARDTVTAYVSGKDIPKVDKKQLTDKLQADGACFVTLQNNKRLRGCIGNMVAVGPLYEGVINNAVSACRDQRFVNDPVTAKELDGLHIEISYLTPLKEIKNVEEIVVGQHGLFITDQWRRGVLLPQVAYERGWTREQFLEQTCRKAGLPQDAWKRPTAKIESFEAEVFGEPE